MFRKNNFFFLLSTLMSFSTPTLHDGKKVGILFSKGRNNILRTSAASESNLLFLTRDSLQIYYEAKLTVPANNREKVRNSVISVLTSENRENRSLGSECSFVWPLSLRDAEDGILAVSCTVFINIITSKTKCLKRQTEFTVQKFRF